MGEWASRVVHLLNDQHMGVVTAAVSLIETLVKKHPDEYKGCVQLAVSRLSRVSSWIGNKTKLRGQLSKIPHTFMYRLVKMHYVNGHYSLKKIVYCLK